MDALTLLEQDHQKVKKLMGEIEKTTERGVKSRQQLFTKLVDELTIHEKIEEQIFYPAVKERATSKQLEELVAESYEEHHFVDIVKAEIEDTPFESEEWAAKFKVMMENIEHHAFEEEEGKMFPKVRKAFKKDELEDMGARMEELKDQLIDVVPTASRSVARPGPLPPGPLPLGSGPGRSANERPLLSRRQLGIAGVAARGSRSSRRCARCAGSRRSVRC
jgi:hemerythrin superfamily protein